MNATSDDAILLKQIGRNRAIRVKLPQGQSLLGRDPECDVVLNHASVSRHHARLTVTGRMVWIHDLKSRNGTRVNDRPIVEANATVGDQISFASIHFVVSSVTAEQPEIETWRVDGQQDADTRPNVIEILTNAQQRVFQRLLNGMSEKEIAAGLGISRHTVHRHVCRIYELLKVNSRSELLSLFVIPPDAPVPQG